MPLLILAAILALPLAEIALFVAVGARIGALATIGLVIATAIAGILLVRHQGLGTLRRAQADLQHNVMPAGAAAEGLAIVVAGILLVIPGFLTDAVGFLLLVPPLRRLLIARIGGFIGARATVIDVEAAVYRDHRAHGPRGGVIEGEAVEIAAPDAAKLPPRDGSPPRGEP